MNKKEIFDNDFLSNKQKKLFLYDQYFKLFINLYKNNLLPNKILLTGQSGLGKSTFAYHFINFILSDKEDFSYDFMNFTINPLNRSFRLINQQYHSNFYLIENFIHKRTIDIKQVKNMISYLNKTSFQKKIKFHKKYISSEGSTRGTVIWTTRPRWMLPPCWVGHQDASTGNPPTTHHRWATCVP